MILDLYEALLRIESGSTYRTPAQVLMLLPCAEGKTQPVSYYVSKFLARRDRIMSEVVQYPIDDPEYMMPKDAAEARRLKAEGQELTALQSPLVAAMAERISRNEDSLTTLRMQAEFLPLDVLIHRALNGTEGQESEE